MEGLIRERLSTHIIIIGFGELQKENVSNNRAPYSVLEHKLLSEDKKKIFTKVLQ